MHKKAKIVVVGSLNMDVVVKSNRPAQVGETILGEEVHLLPGGKGANQAVASARLGAETKMVGVVGKDPFGQALVNSLEEAGVHIGRVRQTDQAMTGVASILLSQGDNSIIVVPGANALCNKEVVHHAQREMEAADVVLLQLEIPLSTVLHTAKLAKSMNKTVILNPAPAQPLSDECLSIVDYITPNRTELFSLTAASEESDLLSAMNQLQARGARNIVTTLGDKGALILTEDGKLQEVPGIPVEPVDTTGAGDAFNAGLAVALAEGKRLEKAVSFANRVAALAVTKLGAQAGMPDRKEVDEGIERE